MRICTGIFLEKKSITKLKIRFIKENKVWKFLDPKAGSRCKQLNDNDSDKHSGRMF